MLYVLIFFQITNENFDPAFSLTEINENITCMGYMGPEFNCEVTASFKSGFTEKFLIVPFVRGKKFPAEFLLRLFVDESETE